MAIRYINIRNTAGEVETIDEFTTDTKEERKELQYCLREYISDYRNTEYHVYTSQRATKEWQESK